MVGCDSANVPVPSACICVHLWFQFFASFGTPMTTAYAELQVTTNYSFLRGASHIEELFAQAAMLGLPALGITDRNSLAGIVRAHQRAQETRVRLVVGCRLDLTDGTSVLTYPTDRPAYSRLCRLLTIGKSRAGKGACGLDWDDLTNHADGLIAILCTPPTRRKTSAPESRLRRPSLRRPDSPTPPQRRGPPATDRRPRAAGAPPHRRHRRRAVSRAAAPHSAGRADLHPRGLHHRRCRLPPRTLSRSPPEIARRKWHACSHSIRTPSRAPWRSPTAAAFRSTNCATNIRTRCASPA